MDAYLLQLGIITSLWMAIDLSIGTFKFAWKSYHVDKSDQRSVDRIVRTTIWHDYKEHIFYAFFASYLAVTLQLPIVQFYLIGSYFIIARYTRGFTLLKKHPKRAVYLRCLGNLLVMWPVFYLVGFCLITSFSHYAHLPTAAQ